MKNCIGKDLSKIPVPVNFSEPLSMLQRLVEDFEYSEILDSAAQCSDNCEQVKNYCQFSRLIAVHREIFFIFRWPLLQRSQCLPIAQLPSGQENLSTLCWVKHMNAIEPVTKIGSAYQNR